MGGGGGNFINRKESKDKAQDRLQFKGKVRYEDNIEL